MAQPVVYNGSSVWVDNGLVWGVPQFRLGGLHTTSNAEFSTKVFVVPEQHMVSGDAGALSIKMFRR